MHQLPHTFPENKLAIAPQLLSLQVGLRVFNFNVSPLVFCVVIHLLRHRLQILIL